MLKANGLKSTFEPPLKLNIQHFAEGEGTSGEGGEGGDGAGGDENGEGSGGEPSKLELTEDELNKRIEAESDRKLNSALQKEREKLKKELEDKVKEERQEAERLAQLTEKERQQAEWEKREKAIEEREAAIKQQELRADAIESLSEKKLPTKFADFVLADDAKKTLENINSLKEEFDRALDEAVTEKLRGKTPSAGTSNSSGVKNPFKRETLNLTEQGRLYREDRAMYDRLKKEANA